MKIISHWSHILFHTWLQRKFFKRNSRKSPQRKHCISLDIKEIAHLNCFYTGLAVSKQQLQGHCVPAGVTWAGRKSAGHFGPLGVAFQLPKHKHLLSRWHLKGCWQSMRPIGWHSFGFQCTSSSPVVLAKMRCRACNFIYTLATVHNIFLEHQQAWSPTLCILCHAGFCICFSQKMHFHPHARPQLTCSSPSFWL